MGVETAREFEKGMGTGREGIGTGREGIGTRKEGGRYRERWTSEQ